MHRTLLLAMIVAGLAAGCGKKTDDASGGGGAKPAAPTPPAAPPAPPPPFTGKLTIERVMGLKEAIGSPPPRALADALARAKGQAGEPTKVDGDKLGWAVIEGDDCAYAYITKDGDNVASVTSPMKVAKGELPGNRSECMKMAGVEPGPPEDPDAAAPPTDGKPVTVDAFRTTALAGRSKWKDQVVGVKGVVAGVTTSTSNGVGWTTVTLSTGKDDAGKPVACSAKENETATVKLGDTAIATGKVKINEWTSMGSGETTLEAALAECTAVVAKGK